MVQNTDVFPASIGVLNPQQVTAVSQLGPLQSHYKITYNRWSITMIILGIVGGIVFAFFSGMAFFVSQPAQIEPAALMICVSVGFLALALYLFLVPILYRWSVYICAYGFLFIKNEKIEVVRWEDIEAVWQRVTKHYTNGVYAGTSHKYTVRRKDGLVIVLNDRFKQVEKMGNEIIEQSKQHMLPSYLAAYQAGQTVLFGPLSINQQGANNGKELLPWPQVKGITIQKGVLTITREGNILSWYTKPTSQIPNLAVLMGLLQIAFKGNT